MEIIKGKYYTDGYAFFRSGENTIYKGNNILGDGVRITTQCYASNNHFSIVGESLRLMNQYEIDYLDRCIEIEGYLNFIPEIISSNPCYEIY